MKRSRFTEEQIIGILRPQGPEAWSSRLFDLCPSSGMGISDCDFFTKGAPASSVGMKHL